MDEVVSTNAEAISVASGDDNVQVVVCHLHTGRDSERAAVERVHAIGIHVTRQVRRAPNAANGNHVVRLNVQLKQHLLE